jgi:replicative DNA helicase
VGIIKLLGGNMSKPKINFELLALAKLLRERDQTLFLELDQELFTNHYQSIFKLVLKTFSDSHQIPDIKILEATINSKAPPAIRPVLNSILTALNDVDLLGVSTEMVSTGLRDKRLLTVVDTNIQELNTLALHKDTDGVRRVLNQIVEEVNLDSVKPTDFFTAMDAPDRSKIITSGIESLDEYITGYAGLTIISGGSGSGKSIWLLQSAIGQYLAGMNVLFVSLELSPQVLGNRLKSFITGIPFKKINTNDLTDEERTQIAEAMKEFKNRENVFRIVSDPLDTNELLNLIKVEKALYDVDVVYLDYLNLVGTPRNVSSGWSNLAETAKELHRLSMSIGVVTVSASQINIEKAPKPGAFPVLSTRGSRELEFSATLWLFLYAPEVDDDSSADGLVVYVVKNRNNEQRKILFEKKFSVMRFDLIMEV